MFQYLSQKTKKSKNKVGTTEIGQEYKNENHVLDTEETPFKKIQTIRSQIFNEDHNQAEQGADICADNKKKELKKRILHNHGYNVENRVYAGTPSPGILKKSNFFFNEGELSDVLGIHTSGDNFLKSLSKHMKNDDIEYKKKMTKPPMNSIKGAIIKQEFDAKAKLRKGLIAVYGFVKFKNIMERTRTFGTSKLMYDISFRERSNVKKALFERVPKKDRKPTTWMLLPTSKFSIFWNFVIGILILYTITFMPYGMLFYPDNELKIQLESYMNIIFIMDIIVNFTTCIIDHEDNLITDWSYISIQYLRSWFILDLLSSIPLDLFISTKANRYLRILKMPRLVKISKMSKLIKFERILHGTALFYYMRIHGGIVKVIGLVFSTILLLHFATCVWCTLGLLESDFPKTWVYRYQLVNSPNFVIYFAGFYYCFQVLTTVGYGDIVAKTNSKTFLK